MPRGGCQDRFGPRAYGGPGTDLESPFMGGKQSLVSQESAIDKHWR